jgi:glycosyltransferase involved in cell wall biosynthesis
MRILYWTAQDLREDGGGTTHVLEVVRHLGAQGLLILLCTRRNAASPRPMPNCRAFGVPVFGPRLLAVLWFEFCALLVVPYLRLRGRVDVVYSRFSPLTVVLPVVCRLLRIPYVAEFNGLTGQEFALLGHPRWMAHLVDWVDRFNFKMATRSVCVTEGIRSTLMAATRKPAEASVVIGNGADGDVFYPLDRAECRDRLHLEPEAFWIGFVGLFARWQGLELLIEAVKDVHHDHPGLRAVVVGDGELRTELEQAAAGCDFILFTGRVPHALVPTYLGAVDVTYVCKRGLSGGFSPVKLYEYMAAGRPVICSRADGISELVAQGCGFQFDADNPPTLADAIRTSMQDRQRLHEMGEKARALAVQAYTWEAIARQTAQVLEGARHPAAHSPG